MSKLTLILATFAAAMILGACNQGGGSSTPVTTPTSNPQYLYAGPGADSPCLAHQNFHDQDDMCRRLRDGSVNICHAQDRYSLFQTACPNLRWQDRDDGEPVPGRNIPPRDPGDRR